VYDAAQLTQMAVEKTTNKEECAFCGKTGHHHSVCPKRRTNFSMAGVRCAACGNMGHTARDCKGDRSNLVKLVNTSHRPGAFEDDEFAAFEAEMSRRGMS
jgi:hypothetical protein